MLHPTSFRAGRYGRSCWRCACKYLRVCAQASAWLRVDASSLRCCRVFVSGSMRWFALRCVARLPNGFWSLHGASVLTFLSRAEPAASRAVWFLSVVCSYGLAGVHCRATSTSSCLGGCYCCCHFRVFVSVFLQPCKVGKAANRFISCPKRSGQRFARRLLMSPRWTKHSSMQSRVAIKTRNTELQRGRTRKRSRCLSGAASFSATGMTAVGRTCLCRSSVCVAFPSAT